MKLPLLKFQHRFRGDSRPWVLGCLLSLVLVKLLPLGPELYVYQIFLLVAALSLRVGLCSLLKRSFWALPFCLAALPVLFTHPGQSVGQIGGLSYSVEGFQKFALIVGHCWLCFQTLLLVTAKVGPQGFLAGLGRLGLPKALFHMLTLALRYLELLSEEAQRMQRARKLRSGKEKLPWKQRLEVTAFMVGTLFLRTLDRAQRVQTAMSLRGNGKPWSEPAEEEASPLAWAVLALLTVLLVWMIFKSA